MQRNHIFYILLIFWTFFLLFQVNGFAEEHPVIQGVGIQLQEITVDGKFDVFPENRFRKVDVNSILKLDFIVPPALENVRQSPAWQSLAVILDTLIQLSEQVKSLTERGRLLLATNAPHDAEFTRQVDEVMAGAVRMLQLFVNPPVGEPILSRQELTALMIQRKDDPYTALTEVITARQNQLHEQAAGYAKEADKFEVIVRAFRLPPGGQKQALHVPGYDNLPQGDFRPANPLAILPSQGEFKKILGELEASRYVQSGIQEIQKNGLAIKNNFEQLISDLYNAVTGLETRIHSEIFEALPNSWETLTNDSFLADIAELSIPESNAPAVLSQELREIRTDVQDLKELSSSFSELKNNISGLKIKSGISFSGIKSIVKNVSPLSKNVQKSFKRVTQWKVRFEKIAAALPVITSHVTEGSMKNNLLTLKSDVLSSMQTSRLGIEAEFPRAIHAFSFLWDISSKSKIVDLGQSMATIGSGESPQYIPHPLKDLKPAELDLRYTGMNAGDQLSITVDIQPLQSDSAEYRLNPPAVSYNMETTFVGWHRKYQSSLIFSKTRQGPMNQAFQSNFALALEWHHYNRTSPNSFLNKLDVAFGLHAAFLEHDVDENFEMGGGVNISVLQGLIRAGYGYNISTKKNNEYWFVGFGLFAMLSQIRDLGNEISGAQ